MNASAASSPMNLMELLRSGATTDPVAPLVLAPDQTVTWAQARERAERLAVGLARRRIERFGVARIEPGELIPLLAAASAVGAEPCVYPADSDSASLARAFGHTLVLDAEDLDDMALEGELPGPAGGCPVLILTTGTTGHPKGARHDWRRLLGAVRRRSDLVGSRWLLAYNVNQFAGLQVILHVLANNASLVQPASNQPRQAWEAIKRQEVTHASATPTFWRFLLNAVDATSDQVSLRQITLGGEAVAHSLLTDLAATFPNARISQIYASTEFGSSVSVRDFRDGLPIEVLEREAGVRFRVVDGELQARSSVGMLGYYGQPDLDDGWLPTGDLVEVRGDRIFFVGRSSDVINVGGVKVHPLPVEHVVNSASGVAMSAAYGRPNPVVGAIVSVDVVTEPGADEEGVRAAINAACSALPEAARPRRIRFVESLEVRGGKIRRGAQV